MFHRAKKVEFIGGPYDGHRQMARVSKRDCGELISIPVSVNVFRVLAGEPPGVESPASSVAVYQLRKHKNRYNYHFVEAKTMEEFLATTRKV
jgi:hypothetical protein